jgi:hypothetical protein
VANIVLLGKRCKSCDEEASAMLASVGELLRDPGQTLRILVKEFERQTYQVFPTAYSTSLADPLSFYE